MLCDRTQKSKLSNTSVLTEKIFTVREKAKIFSSMLNKKHEVYALTPAEILAS